MSSHRLSLRGREGQAWGGGGDRTSLRVPRPGIQPDSPASLPDALDSVVGVSATNNQAG